MTLTKKLKFDQDVLDIIASMRWDVENDGSVCGTLTCGQLERNLYIRVDKALKAMGGKWNRKLGAHRFLSDPRPLVEGLLNDGVLEVERDGYFLTPMEIGTQMARWAELYEDAIVLEPSAGTGDLVDAILAVEPTARVYCYEKNEQRAKVLRRKFGDRLDAICHWDFLGTHRKYARIVQNPPFENFQDIDHVLHAYWCLASGGILVSVMSESPFFRTDHKAVEFREWLDGVRHEIIDLEPGAFRSSGTGVKARLVKVWK